MHASLLKKIIPIAVAMLSALCLTMTCQASPDKPAVLYYSRAGTTAAVATVLADRLDCPAIAVHSQKKRTGLWTITCVLDQLLDRDDETAAAARPLPLAQPLIVAVPIWIHRIASPMRSYLASQLFHDNNTILILTHQGNFGEKDIRDARNYLQACGLNVRAVYDIRTSDLSSAELKGRAEKLAARLQKNCRKTLYKAQAVNIATPVR